MSTLHPKNQPKHRYRIGFDADNGCFHTPRCGTWNIYHQTVDMNGKVWTDLGSGWFENKEDALASLAGKPTEWEPYHRNAQAILDFGEQVI